MSAARQSRGQASAASDQQKKVIAGAVFGVILLGVLYYELADVFFTATPPPAAPPVILSGPSPASSAGPAAPSAARTSATPATPRAAANAAAALDPTLHMQPMLVTEAVLYNGTGRNIFSTAAPLPAAFVPLPKVTGPIRPSGAIVPTYTPPPGPPPLPPIDLKFFGLATSSGRRQAFLLHGDDVFLAAEGDIVLRKYRVVTIGPASIQVEDLTNNNKQTLPLLVNP